MTVDVLFVTDANASAGFGHTARCLAICQLLDPNHEVAFQGDFSPHARARIEAAYPRAKIWAPEEPVEARVGFIDRLAHPDKLDFQDETFIQKIAARTARLIALSSGFSALKLPAGAICVGYQPSDVKPYPPHLLWSYDYAPVPHGFCAQEGPIRDEKRLLIALGGHPNDAPLRRVLGAVSNLAQITDVDVLLSPAMARTEGDYVAGEHQTLTLHENVPSVAPLLLHAGGVIASYGNLVYEALAIGCAVCVVGQKAFQVQLAEAMAAEGCVVFGGAVADALVPDFNVRVLDTFQRAESLARRGQELIDGKGLARLADLIQSAWESTRRKENR